MSSLRFRAACLMLCLSGAMFRPAAAGEALVAAVPRHFPPHYTTSADGEPEGFAIDVMNALAYPVPVTLRLARSAGLEDHIKAVGPPLVEIKRALAVRSEDAALLARLDASVAAFTQSREYRDIYNKWYGLPRPFWALTAAQFWSIGAVVLALGLAIGWRLTTLGRLNRRLRHSLALLAQTQSELQVSERRLTEAQRMAKIGNWELELATGRLYWSDEIYHIFGMDPDRFEATYEAFLSTIHPEDRERVNRTYTTAVEQGVPYELVHRIVTPAGEVKHVHERSREVKDAHGRTVRSIGTVQDVTALKRTEEALKHYQHHLEELVEARTTELAEAKERAEAANRAKTLFLANMSHELRTPLSAVLGFAKLMSHDPAITERQREYLAIIDRSGEHLLALINDVLDMSKIEAGRMVVEPEPVDLHELLREIVDLMRNRAESRGLCLSVEQDPTLPHYVRADRAKLRQVFINLLGNAVKYTEQGGVILRLRGEPADAERVVVRCEVEDTGMGIPPEAQERVFEPFVQLAQRADAQGTGLGLAITRQYIQLMGGNLTLHSDPGHGSVFGFTLPVKPATAEEALSPLELPGRVIALEPGQEACRILIAEDVVETRLLLRRLLEPVGFEVREVENGQEAVEQFRSWRPHLIWMDWRMPVMDGIEATRRIKGMEGGRATIIVALTASVFREQRSLVLESGCDDFLRKPFREEEIFETIARHLGVRYLYERSAGEGPEAPPAPAITAEALVRLPRTALAELRQAAIECDSERLAQLVEGIRPTAADVAAALERLARVYRYPEILDLLEHRTPDGPARGADERNASTGSPP